MMGKPRITALYLDFGNVCESVHFSRFITAFSAHTNIDATEVENAFFADRDYSKFFEAFELGEISPTKFFHVLTKFLQCEERIDFETFSNFWIDVFTKENQELDHLLANLKVRKFLLSNTNELAYNSYISQQKIVRTHFPTERERVLSYRIGILKPHASFYQFALKHSGAIPAQTLFIDDVEENIATWRSLGGHGVVYNANTHSIDYLTKELRRYAIGT